jgi:nucleoside-diphosphate-sugar epimerase
VTTLIIGCGYLGQRVGVLLRDRGEQVFGTVRSEARAAKIASLGIEPVVADVLRPHSLHGLPAAERVFYCVGYDRAAGASMHAVYVDGLMNVLDQLPSGVSRVVYASSTGVYGETDGEWVNEDTPALPRTEPGKFCLEAEERLLDWAKRRQSTESAVRLRFAGLYGPSRVVRRTLIEQGKPIPGDPDKMLNLIHIDDAAQAVVAALAVVAPGPVVLIGDDRPVARREYYSQVAKLLGSPAPRFVPSEAGSSNEARDATSKRVANHRMKARLGLELIYPDIASGLPAALSASSRP